MPGTAQESGEGAESRVIVGFVQQGHLPGQAGVQAGQSPRVA